ncbi:hypothetical protein Golax_011405 [Gossypium laxum]|uniref:RNase H type-1 domain-containing protein n=1 Tax=Gossypium laxum TaxID=34288 RepID=A0A7J8ZKT3_9ROSI|nr:hypothetical protein [Gossypium laxum]
MTIGRWQPPMADWVKVNVDGLVSRNNPKASVGGLVRGPSGGWLVGFKMVLEPTTMMNLYDPLHSREVIWPNWTGSLLGEIESPSPELGKYGK